MLFLLVLYFYDITDQKLQMIKNCYWNALYTIMFKMSNIYS